jgi:ABC-type glycerol-3-phosphate transport system permease component
MIGYGDQETHLLRWIGNALVFAGLSTASIVSTPAIAGCVLGKFDLPWFPVVFGIIIATSVVPFEVYMRIRSKLGWRCSRPALRWISVISARAGLALIPSALFFSLMRRNCVRGVAGTGLKE